MRRGQKMSSAVTDGVKVAITSTGKTLSSTVDGRFGRCEYFLIVDEKTGNMMPVPNGARSLGGGAGIQAAQQIVNLGVQAIVTGDVGPNAFRVLATAGIRMFVGSSGTCESALADYREGRLREASAATSPGHHGHGGHGFGGGRGGQARGL
jgi:predicted Fe-Mo cluster-binding NifX family protein